jgi:hypothetical protein
LEKLLSQNDADDEWVSWIDYALHILDIFNDWQQRFGFLDEAIGDIFSNLMIHRMYFLGLKIASIKRNDQLQHLESCETPILHWNHSNLN